MYVLDYEVVDIPLYLKSDASMISLPSEFGDALLMVIFPLNHSWVSLLCSSQYGSIIVCFVVRVLAWSFDRRLCC